MNDLISDLKRKVDLQRGAHSFYEISAKRTAVLTKTILIVLPAFITFAAFSDFDFLKTFIPNLTEEMVRLSIGTVSFILFIVGVVSETFGVIVKHEKHREAIEQYSELQREIREAGTSAKDKSDVFNQRYISISSNAVSMNSAEFRKAERYFLRNKALREARKRDPFGSCWSVRKAATQIAKTESSDCT